MNTHKQPTNISLRQAVLTLLIAIFVISFSILALTYIFTGEPAFMEFLRYSELPTPNWF